MELFLKAYVVIGVALGEVLKAFNLMKPQYIVLVNILIAVPIAGATLGWSFGHIVEGLEAALAAGGLYEVGKRVVPKQGG